MGVRYEAETSPKEVHNLTDPRCGRSTMSGRDLALDGTPAVEAYRPLGLRHLLQLDLPVTYQTTPLQPPSVQVLEINAPRLAERPRSCRSSAGDEAHSARSTELVSLEPGPGHSL